MTRLLSEFAGLFALAILATVALLQPASAQEGVPLNDGWQFTKGDPQGASAPSHDDAGWSSISVPHTYNAEDSGIGGAKARGEPEGEYYRGPAWYRLSFEHVPAPGKRQILHFGGATLKADVWLNGRKVGTHRGGYAAFRFDVTDELQAGRNVLAVRVDNAKNPEISPLNGDFNVFGGLYREVRLIEVPELHLDRMNHAGPAIRAWTEAIGDDTAKIGSNVAVVNTRSVPAQFEIDTQIIDADGKQVATQREQLQLAAGESRSVASNFTVSNPKLWRGREGPYLYRIRSQIRESGALVDSQSVPLGIRTVAVEKDGTFLLNGKAYPLYGVNMQMPTRFGRGPIVTDGEIDEDMRLIDEMGATGIRLAHMQHPPRVYERADELGMLILTEVPLIDDHDQSDAFRENLVQQMEELIAQHTNNPSVALWGIGNEIRVSDAASNRLLAELNETAHTLDPYRPTTYAHCCLDDDDPIAQHSDTVSYNRYFGWYWTKSEDIGPWADELHAKMPNRPIGVSEYGAGASIRHQEDPVVKRPESNGYWHPEQYQTDFHIKHWLELKKRPFLWSTFVWVAIDFPSFKRNEGDRPAINDKGLITEDRIPKDAYYWYQANWAEEPMLHIASSRDTHKRTQQVKAMAFSNLPRVEVRLNGGEWTGIDVEDRMAKWTIELEEGANLIEARARTQDGRLLTDKVGWRYDLRP
ncbi:glycoside hydrolase family 2 protein [Croceicoccus mobilis]|uniref:Beta-galactosidase n=1 Tax=Croceicoccus mobilis TaxID=1703339 RepID=A0A916YQY5_9SPHN|nr:glycoside hydrolase family 2 [Croceicoccus mobilis]GGD57573.1 beta-galactosidase [Croceicoccus mobilis]